MSFVRNRFLSFLVLLGLFGVVSYFATMPVHDRLTTHVWLFTNSWIFSSIGLVFAAAVVFGFASDGSSDYKAPPKLAAMNRSIGLVLLCTATGWLIVSSMGCFDVGSHIVDGTRVGGQFDWPRFMSLYVSALAGEAVGFALLVAWHFDKSWMGRKLPSPRVAADDELIQGIVRLPR